MFRISTFRVSVAIFCASAFACESSPSSDADPPQGGSGGSAIEAEAGAGGSTAGSETQGGSDPHPGAAGSEGLVEGGSESAGGSGPQGDAGGPDQIGGAPTGSGVAVSELDECKYDATTCAGNAAKPHYWECVNDPGVAPADGCELSNVNAVSSWCCPEPFCSAYAGAASLCEGIYPDQPNSYICAQGTSGLGDCQQPNPISLSQVYCCPD